MKKTILTSLLIIASTNANAANRYDQNFSFKLGGAKHSFEGTKLTKSTPIAIGFDYTNYLFPLSSNIDLGMSAGANIAIAYDTIDSRYHTTSVRTDYGTGYIAPVISFKPNDVIDLYARIGGSINYLAATINTTTIYNDHTSTHDETALGLYYAAGINIALGRKVFAGLEYTTNIYDVEGDSIKTEIAYAKFGFRF